jgi:hypothetical protein
VNRWWLLTSRTPEGCATSGKWLWRAVYWLDHVPGPSYARMAITRTS